MTLIYYAIIITLIAVAVVLRFTAYPFLFIRPGHLARWQVRFTFIPRTDRKPVPDCVDSICFGRVDKHRRCTLCKGLTTSRTMRIDPISKQRKSQPLCSGCSLRPSIDQDEQIALQKTRRLEDIEKVTVPAMDSHMDYEQMQDQYASLTRDTIRSMLSSDAEEATVFGIKAQTLNQSLLSTGLDDEMYAETRNGTTVLRRIEKG